MELLIALIAFLALDIAVYLWGADTRDGKDWQVSECAPGDHGCGRSVHGIA